jgi:hypothetical protein
MQNYNIITFQAHAYKSLSHLISLIHGIFPKSLNPLTTNGDCCSRTGGISTVALGRMTTWVVVNIVLIWKHFFHPYPTYLSGFLCGMSPDGESWCVQLWMFLVHPCKASNSRDMYVNTLANCAILCWVIPLWRRSVLFISRTGVVCGLNINSVLWSQLLIDGWMFFSGVLYRVFSDRTNTKIPEISMKIYVYSYRTSHRPVYCSSGAFCRSCVAEMCNTAV